MTSQRVELENLVCTGVVLRLYGRNKAVHARVQRYREHHTGVFTVNSPKYDIDTMKAPCTTRTTSKTSSLPIPTCANPQLATPHGMHGLDTHQTCNRSDGRDWGESDSHTATAPPTDIPVRDPGHCRIHHGLRNYSDVLRPCVASHDGVNREIPAMGGAVAQQGHWWRCLCDEPTSAM